MIALIDYGAGNLTSVRKALSALGATFMTPETAGDLVTVQRIIVPGVGHFGATGNIDDPWRRAMRAAIDRGASLLGICLGMQWLYDGSDEAPGVPGLGVLHGTCMRLAPSASGTAHAVPGTRDLALKIPHVGWNGLEIPRASALMTGVTTGDQVYFTHSYVCPITPDTAATTTYAVRFASAVEHDRVAGVQFHPEKSSDVGLRILRNWLALSERSESNGLDAV